MAKNIKKLKAKSDQLKTVKFLPQIYRKINAGFRIFLLFLLFCLLVLNLFSVNSAVDNLKNSILTQSKKSYSHLTLINSFLKNNQLKEAETEVLSSLQFFPDDSSFLQKLAEIKKIKNRPQELKQEIKKWEKIVSDKPNYRDGFFQLAILYYQLYDKQKAVKYLNKVFSLDPNFEPAKDLMKLIVNE